MCALRHHQRCSKLSSHVWLWLHLLYRQTNGGYTCWKYSCIQRSNAKIKGAALLFAAKEQGLKCSFGFDFPLSAMQNRANGQTFSIIQFNLAHINEFIAIFSKRHLLANFISFFFFVERCKSNKSSRFRCSNGQSRRFEISIIWNWTFSINIKRYIDTSAKTIAPHTDSLCHVIRHILKINATIVVYCTVRKLRSHRGDNWENNSVCVGMKYGIFTEI